jgi:hypothetical protein
VAAGARLTATVREIPIRSAEAYLLVFIAMVSLTLRFVDETPEPKDAE